MHLQPRQNYFTEQFNYFLKKPNFLYEICHVCYYLQLATVCFSYKEKLHHAQMNHTVWFGSESSW